MIKYLMKISNVGEIILICLGPLTNLAKAIRLYPSLLNEIKSLYIMGGNVDTKEKKYIEFNFAYDAEAAKIVFDEINELQKSNTYLIPFSTPLNMLNVTKKWRKEELGKLRSAQIKLLNNAERVTLNNLVSKSTGKLTPYGPMDPSLTLFLLDNEKLSEYSNNDDQVLFMTRNISVTTCPENERGSTNIFHSHETKSVKIITQLNQNRIQQMLFKYLQ